MIHNVYVFDENGAPIAEVKVGSIEADSTLMAGFLSAMQSFMKKIAQGEIEELNTNEYTFHIRKVESVYVALVSDKRDRNARSKLNLVSEIIANSKGRYDDEVMKMRIRYAVTHRESVADRARTWGKEVL